MSFHTKTRAQNKPIIFDKHKIHSINQIKQGDESHFPEGFRKFQNS